MSFKKGDRVLYRAMAGDRYQAQILNARPDGRYDINITIPGCRAPYTLHTVNGDWLERDVGQPFGLGAS